MKSKALILLIAAVTSATVAGFTQDPKKPTDGAANKTAAAPAADEKPKLTQEQLEEKFKATFAKATLSGQWCSIDNGELGPVKDDKYTIVSATKTSGDSWIINAKMKYGQREIDAPIPVRVKWAGDTAVIIVDNLSMGGRNKYTARVLVFEKTYAGTWSSGDHGGLLNGIITNEKE